MLTRERTLTHPKGGTVDLPLLVPSFSSKGFTFFKNDTTKTKHEYSEVTHALENLSTYIKESILVSAYDLYHGHYRQPVSRLKNIALVFIDSGFYELSPTFDSTEPKHFPHVVKSFTEEDYCSEVSKLSKHALPLVITNYDWSSQGRPFAEQIQHAQSFFSSHPGYLTDFILKPDKAKGVVIDIDALVPHLAKLKAFDVIGVPEQELGKNLIDRLRRLAQLRSEMNKRHMSAPIHVWGGIDPIMTPLYFFAGADIFDGISWMRYSYHKGFAVNRQCFAVLEGNISTPQDHAIHLSMNKNLMELQRLATNLRAFLDSGFTKFDVFESNAELFQKAYTAMTAKVDELKGGR
jgi:hypothetical protein